MSQDLLQLQTRVEQLERQVRELLGVRPDAAEPRTAREHPHLDLLSSWDFGEVIAGKRRYSFRGEAQRAIIRALWRASLGSQIGCTNEELARAAGTVAGDFRTMKCFCQRRRGRKSVHAAWGTLIGSSGGRYFLIGARRKEFQSAPTLLPAAPVQT